MNTSEKTAVTLIAFGAAMVVAGFHDLMLQKKIAVIERRVENLDIGMADLATRQTMTELKATEALADLAALRQAILAAGRNLPRWTTTNTIDTNLNAPTKP